MTITKRSSKYWVACMIWLALCGSIMIIDSGAIGAWAALVISQLWAVGANLSNDKEQ